MNSAEPRCSWRQALRWLRLYSLRFHGGAVDLGSDPPEGEGIARIASDAVAVVSRDLEYWIPFAALRDVTGTCAREANPVVAVSLRAVLSGWVDQELDPADPQQILWHSFITRAGRGYAGAVRAVSDAGILLSTRESPRLVIRWEELGAAIERLE